jgi:hypothetical protein
MATDRHQQIAAVVVAALMFGAQKGLSYVETRAAFRVAAVLMDKVAEGGDDNESLSELAVALIEAELSPTSGGAA